MRRNGRRNDRWVLAPAGDGKIVTRPVRGGVIICLPDEADQPRESVLKKIWLQKRVRKRDNENFDCSRLAKRP